MSDTITPDEYRAAAKVLRTDGATRDLGNYFAEAAWCEDQAARLEAGSARDEEAEKLAKAAWESLEGAAIGGRVPDWMPGFVRAVLDQLAADGRLLPEGGTVTAVVKPIGWYRTMEPDFATEHFGFPDPSEEIRHQAGDGGKWVWDFDQWELREYPPAVSVPDSGPDGTPEKPWPTAAEIPIGVDCVRDRYGCVWVYRSTVDKWLRVGKCVHDCSRSIECAEIAPFVRVEGDKA